ncbi:MAG: glycosyltransferase N-terminal domain-containing protein [Eudoraea sp.]
MTKKRILATNSQYVYILYNLAIYITSFFLPVIAFFSAKVKLFINGRKNVFTELKKQITEKDSTIWIHAASLGEYEQGLPIVEKLKAEYPTFKIVVSFFSPSGYEVVKHSTEADLVTYLPLDTMNNAKRFVKLLQPKIAIFIKYEIWPNMLNELHKSGIPILLISAIFKSDQIYFKWYGGFMRNALKKFSHFFIQDSESLKLLNSIGMDNTTISGDTRFDRVSEILQKNNSLEFMDNLTQNYPCFVMGSTWSEDEEILVDYINASSHQMKYVIAPHRITPKDIERLRQSIKKHSLLLSESSGNFSGEPQVLIVDSIGLLTKIYSYADIAYVGGAFLKGGLHNTLEPAVFGIPVIIGPNYEGFKEAEELVKLNGVFPVGDKAEFTKLADKLFLDSNFRLTAGSINISYINKNKGASIQVMNHIRTLI